MNNKLSSFLLQMVTPEQIIYQQMASKLIVSTFEGEITILPDHTSLVASIKPGEVKITETTSSGSTKKERLMAISEGVVEVTENTVRLLVQSADRVEELNRQKILEAKKLAEDMIEKAKKGGKIDESSFANLEATLQREIARLKVYDRYRRKG